MSFAIGVLGFVAGAALVLMIPKHQSVMKLAIIAIAALVLALDAGGVRLVDFGSTIDPENPQRLVPLSEVLGPRFGFLGFLGGIISFGVSQSAQTIFGMIIAGSIIMRVSGGFSALP